MASPTSGLAEWTVSKPTPHKIVQDIGSVEERAIALRGAIDVTDQGENQPSEEQKRYLGQDMHARFQKEFLHFPYK